MNQILIDTLDSLKIEKELSYNNITMLTIHEAKETEPDYLTLDEAIGSKSKAAKIVEVSEDGNVPELAFKNNLDKPVLLVDGEEVLGAKQNRIINLTILAPPKKKLNIPVSCVERSRWKYKSKEFEASQWLAASRIRAKNIAQVSYCMSSHGQRESDQGEVWDDIEELSDTLGVDSKTEAMSDIYKKYVSKMDEIKEHIKPKELQKGAVFCVNGEIVGLELFDSSITFKKLFEKIFRSYVLDALATQIKKQKENEIDFKAFIEEIKSSKIETYHSIGIGEDIRITGKKVAGGALITNNRIIHLSAMRPQENRSQKNNRYDIAC